MTKLASPARYSLRLGLLGGVNAVGDTWWSQCIAADVRGDAYVMGRTDSPDYPLIGTLDGFSGTPAIAGAGVITTSMAFVTKLNKQGTALWYSTYLGESGGDAGAGPAQKLFLAHGPVERQSNDCLHG